MPCLTRLSSLPFISTEVAIAYERRGFLGEEERTDVEVYPRCRPLMTTLDRGRRLRTFYVLRYQKNDNEERQEQFCCLSDCRILGDTARQR